MSVIIAIDLGKYNSVFCWFNEDSGEIADRIATTTPESVRTEATRQTVDRDVIVACLQAGWVHDLEDWRKSWRKRKPHRASRVDGEQIALKMQRISEIIQRGLTSGGSLTACFDLPGLLKFYFHLFAVGHRWARL